MPVQAFLTKPTGRWHLVWIAAALSILLLLLAGIKLAHVWPFTRSAMIASLEAFSARPVKIQRFRMTFFPPGCEAEGISFEHHKHRDRPPLVTAEKLVIRGSYSGLLGFRKHLAEVMVSGGHILVPPGDAGGVFPLALSKQARFDIDSAVAHNVVIEFRSAEPGKAPYIVKVEQAKVQHGGRQFVAFQASFTTSKPNAQVHSQGQLKWNPGSPGSTPVSGIYRVEHADLAAFGGIAGLLGSNGNFNGTLSHLIIDGTSEVPDFRVTRSTHTVSISSKLHGIVDARSGDTQLDPVVSHFLKTTVTSRGGVLGAPNVPGKTANIELSAEQGRVEDLLLLFIKSPAAPMTGVVNLHGTAKIPPGPVPFLKRIVLDGDFGIGSGRFHNQAAQQKINQLSESSRGESRNQEKADPRVVLSGLSGHVSVVHGIANFPHLTFRADGSDATLHGTFNLISQEIDLHGTLATTGKISEMTSGVKALLVKVITPFAFKKKNGARLIHFKITGTYKSPQVGVDWGGKN